MYADLHRAEAFVASAIAREDVVGRASGAWLANNRMELTGTATIKRGAGAPQLIRGVLRTIGESAGD